MDVTLPQGISSSALRFAYRSHSTTRSPSPRLRSTLRVHAGIALRIVPRVTSAGHEICFSGVLHGTPIPPGGKQLVSRPHRAGNGSNSARSARREGPLPRDLPLQVPRPGDLSLPGPLTPRSRFRVPGGRVEYRQRVRALSWAQSILCASFPAKPRSCAPPLHGSTPARPGRRRRGARRRGAARRAICPRGR